MNFGADFSQYDNFDPALPPDPAFNKSVLPGLPATEFKVYSGMTLWNRKQWIGAIYPKFTKEKDFLTEYMNHFNAVELNATHYKIYTADEISKWATKAEGKDFRFCPKIPQSISHFSDLVSMEATLKTKTFLSSILAFENTLGPVFLQLSDKYSPKRVGNLLSYLRSLPREIDFFLEIRHPDWFIDGNMWKILTNELKRLGIGLIITDTPNARNILHLHLTTSRLFLRFVGLGNHPSDYSRFEEWVHRINQWKSIGLKEAYIFFHLQESPHDVLFAKQAGDLLNV